MSDVPLTPPELIDVVTLDEAVARTTASGGYGLTDKGFVPKPFARLLAEKLALARSLFGNDLDLAAGSVFRKLLELSALEDARTWVALAAMYDDQFVVSARGEALSGLGQELGLPRPYLQARGEVELTYHPVEGRDAITLPNGGRLLTPGGHHAALAAALTLSRTKPKGVAPVVAFFPGLEHNLDPNLSENGVRPMRLERWNTDDPKLVWEGDAPGLTKLASDLGVAPEAIVSIRHDAPLSGGEQGWPDARYRRLLLRAPRSVWSAEAVRVAASLVAGVRQVQVADHLGGLDVDLPIFGHANFGDMLFAEGRRLGSPYHVEVLVAPEPAAFWEGPTGLRSAVASAVEDLRPLGIGLDVQPADQVFVTIEGKVSTDLPLPRAGGALINSPAANEFKQRLLRRVADYVDALRFGEPVRYAEVVWALMNEPGVTDVTELHLLRFPPLDPDAAVTPGGPQRMPVGTNVAVGARQIATSTNDDRALILR